MNDIDSLNTAEYAYEKRAEGTLKIRKILLVCLYVAFFVGFFAFCVGTRIVPLFAVAPIFLWILVFFTWPLVKFDITYTFEHGELQFSKLYNALKGRRKKPLLTVKVSSATRIAPYRGETIDAAVRDLSSSASSDTRVVLEYRDAEDAAHAVIFDTTERIAKLLCSFNRAASDELRKNLSAYVR